MDDEIAAPQMRLQRMLVDDDKNLRIMV